MSKNLAFLMRRSPYAGSRAMESIEAAMVAAVFDQNVTLIFLDDGVYQLISGQEGAGLGLKSVANALRALPAYDIEQLVVAGEALESRGLDPADLAVSATVARNAEIRELIARQDVVLSD